MTGHSYPPRLSADAAALPYPVRAFRTLFVTYAPLFGSQHRAGFVILLLALIATYLTPARMEGTLLYHVAHFFSNPFHTTYLTLSILLLLWTAHSRRCKPSFLCLLTVLLVETAVMQGIKLSTFHLFGWFPRPSGGDGGFPSGHTASNCAMAYLLTEKYPALGPLWYTCAALISWSRWQAGAHYPYQIVAGAILGLTVAVFLSARFFAPAGYNKVGEPANACPDKE